MISRRQLLTVSVAAGAGVAVPGAFAAFRSGLAGSAVALAPGAVPGGTLDPTTITKYVTPLFVPPVMPPTGVVNGVDQYAIAVRRFTQQMLPPGSPATTVLGFGSSTGPANFHSPSATIEAQVGRPVQVTWSNQLVTPAGDYLPHFLTIDPTLHWANPPGGNAGRDSHPTFTSTPPPYTGPIPLVVHLHGAHSFEDSDGHPQAWFLPAARNIPAGYATVGSLYAQFQAEAASRFGAIWQPGTSVYQYGNDQRATALWYHSHDLGMTRVNVYAGLAGMYLLRGGSTDLPAGVLPGPAPKAGDAPGIRYHEMPLVFQDKSFNTDGSLFFPTSRGFFGDTPVNGPWIPTTDTPPYWNPEFFGNTVVVNGNTWPVLQVEPRRYRFRLLNGSNARTYLLKIVTDPLAARPASAALPIWAIGADGGLLPAPTSLSTAWLASGERMDVIVDFTGLTPGTALYLINEGPDEPFHGGAVGVDFDPADPATTGQVMKFVVTTLASPDTSVPPAQLKLPGVTTLGAAGNTRKLSINELDSTTFADAPVLGALGTFNADGTPRPLRWSDPVTETVTAGTTEIWELDNYTQDGHPIHVHQVEFEVVNRQPFSGVARPPESWETGTKDTVMAFPGETTRIKARFDRAGIYVWHCHIVDHEDNEMMRPLRVV
jgi:FtsP/CotA-like multicopper oxidase with cupredoxin domain